MSVRRHVASLDKRLSERLLLPETAAVSRVLATAFAHIGDGWLWALGWGIAYVTSGVRARGEILRWVAAALLSGGLVAALKFMIRRQRPADVPGFYSRRHDRHSFPSGHAARMGVAAWMAPMVWPGWGWLALPGAALVAWARVALGLHYVLDVAVGMALGATVAYLVFRV
jgi:undecaprenyl-diphosphatase